MELVQECCQNIRVEFILHSLHIVGVELVDGIIGEVNTRVPEVFLLLVLDSGEPYESFLIEVHQQGV